MPQHATQGWRASEGTAPGLFLKDGIAPGLTGSTVWALLAGKRQLVKFLAAFDRVFANLAFGREAIDGAVHCRRVKL